MQLICIKKLQIKTLFQKSNCLFTDFLKEDLLLCYFAENNYFIDDYLLEEERTKYNYVYPHRNKINLAYERAEEFSRKNAGLFPNSIATRKKKYILSKLIFNVIKHKDDEVMKITAVKTFLCNCFRTNWVFVKVYTDEGISGTNTKKRDGFNEMIADALAGKISLILTKSVSRFARNTVDSLTTIRTLKAHGTEVYFEKENLDTGSEIINADSLGGVPANEYVLESEFTELMGNAVSVDLNGASNSNQTEEINADLLNRLNLFIHQEKLSFSIPLYILFGLKFGF